MFKKINKQQMEILIWRFIILIICGSGLAVQIIKNGLEMLTYYTILSNLVVFTFLIFLIIKMLKNPDRALKDRYILRIKGGVTMVITITFVVYHFLLAPFVARESYWNYQNLAMHYIVPLMFIFDTIFIDKRKSYKLRDPFLWAFLPLIYSVFGVLNGLYFKISVPGSPDSPFPYFFLNVDKYGFDGVLSRSAGIFTFYIIGGFTLYLIKHLSRSKKQKTSSI